MKVNSLDSDTSPLPNMITKMGCRIASTNQFTRFLFARLSQALMPDSSQICQAATVGTKGALERE